MQDSNRVKTARKHIRGSSLLLLGRCISIGINFVTQILIARHLSKTDYGSWAYALALITFLQAFVTFGLDKGVTRFIPIYHENAEYGKLYGTILLVCSTIVIIGLTFIGAVYLAPQYIINLAGGEGYQAELLLILVFLLPIQGIDELLVGLFASFAHPRAIFFRKHLIGPLLKFTVALLLVVLDSSVVFLAYGYLIANLIGISFYIGLLLRLLKEQGLFQYFSFQSIIVPFKEIFSFTVPVLSSDLLITGINSSVILILGYFHDSSTVASYQVIVPLATVNVIVMHSFGLLYTPMAARLFAKNDLTGINDLYWRTAVWLSILSFPIFILTFSIAKPLTLLFYGARYEDSWVYLQLLSLAYYFNVALGLNGLTLKVTGRVHYMLRINMLVLLTSLLLSFLFIPRYGALGAALSTALSVGFHNVLKQLGLRIASGVILFDRTYLFFYLIIFTSALVLFFAQFYIIQSIYILVPLTILTSCILVKIFHKHLGVHEIFPELVKLPFIRLIFS